MIWIYTRDIPPKAFATNDAGFNKWHIVYCVEGLPADETDATGYAWRYKVAALPTGVWTYDAIVDALVTAEYPAAKMQAVVNNYLSSPDDADIKAEFDQMQAWRKEAKRIAREAIDGVEG